MGDFGGSRTNQKSLMPIEPYTLESSTASFGKDMPRAREHTTEFGARLTALRKAAGYT
jgi:hypothetical protein